MSSQRSRRARSCENRRGRAAEKNDGAKRLSPSRTRNKNRKGGTKRADLKPNRSRSSSGSFKEHTRPKLLDHDAHQSILQTSSEDTMTKPQWNWVIREKHPPRKVRKPRPSASILSEPKNQAGRRDRQKELLGQRLYAPKPLWKLDSDSSSDHSWQTRTIVETRSLHPSDKKTTAVNTRLRIIAPKPPWKLDSDKSSGHFWQLPTMIVKPRPFHPPDEKKKPLKPAPQKYAPKPLWKLDSEKSTDHSWQLRAVREVHPLPLKTRDPPRPTPQKYAPKPRSKLSSDTIAANSSQLRAVRDDHPFLVKKEGPPKPILHENDPRPLRYLNLGHYLSHPGWFHLPEIRSPRENKKNRRAPIRPRKSKTSSRRKAHSDNRHRESKRDRARRSGSDNPMVVMMFAGDFDDLMRMTEGKKSKSDGTKSDNMHEKPCICGKSKGSKKPDRGATTEAKCNKNLYKPRSGNLRRASSAPELLGREQQSSSAATADAWQAPWWDRLMLLAKYSDLFFPGDEEDPVDREKQSK